MPSRFQRNTKPGTMSVEEYGDLLFQTVGAPRGAMKDDSYQVSMEYYLPNEDKPKVYSINIPFNVFFGLDWKDLDPSDGGITDMRIDAWQHSQPNVRRRLPLELRARFPKLIHLVLVGWGNLLPLFPFDWQCSFPALEDVRLESTHAAEDVRAILQGCPKLKSLNIGIIVVDYEDIREKVEHTELTELVLASTLPIGPTLKGLRLPKLKVLDWWMAWWMNLDAACDMTNAASIDAFIDTVDEIRGEKIQTPGPRLSLGLNVDVSDIKTRLQLRAKDCHISAIKVPWEKRKEELACCDFV